MKVITLGAGPAGLFLAYRLRTLHSDISVQLYNCNPDPTIPTAADRRGFGLGLGARIQHWLNGDEELKKYLIDEGVELEKSALILMSRRQLCAAIVRSLRQLNLNSQSVLILR